MSLFSRFLRRFHRPAHIGPWGGDLVNPWTPTWQPEPGLEIR